MSEVVFGESSSGAAIVQGSFVGQGASESSFWFLVLSGSPLSANLFCFV